MAKRQRLATLCAAPTPKEWSDAPEYSNWPKSTPVWVARFLTALLAQRLLMAVEARRGMYSIRQTDPEVLRDGVHMTLRQALGGTPPMWAVGPVVSHLHTLVGYGTTEHSVIGNLASDLHQSITGLPVRRRVREIPLELANGYGTWRAMPHGDAVRDDLRDLISRVCLLPAWTEYVLRFAYNRDPDQRLPSDYLADAERAAHNPETWLVAADLIAERGSKFPKYIGDPDVRYLVNAANPHWAMSDRARGSNPADAIRRCANDPERGAGHCDARERGYCEAVACALEATDDPA